MIAKQSQDESRPHSRALVVLMRTLSTLERKLHLPGDFPDRLVHDIEAYSALVDMQEKMSDPHASWYAQLT